MNLDYIFSSRKYIMNLDYIFSSRKYIMNGYKKYNSANLNNYDEYDLIKKQTSIVYYTISGQVVKGTDGQNVSVNFNSLVSLYPNQTSYLIDLVTTMNNIQQHNMTFHLARPQNNFFSIGTVSGLIYGSLPSITMSKNIDSFGDAYYTQNYNLVSGPKGDKGDIGMTPNFIVGSITSLPYGSTPTVTYSISGLTYKTDYGLVTGAKGDDGGTPNFVIGSVTTLPYGSEPSVTYTQTGLTYTTNYQLVTGPPGNDGQPGDSATAASAGAIAGSIAGAAAGSSSGSAAGSTSGSIAGTTSGATAGTNAANTAIANLNPRFQALETKTRYQYSDTIDRTTFDGQLVTRNSTGLTNKIILDGDLQRITCGTSTIDSNIITSPNLNTNTIEATDSYSDINIGKFSSKDIHIGNQLTAGNIFTETNIYIHGHLYFGTTSQVARVNNMYQF